jgi:prephenate dehydratase
LSTTDVLTPTLRVAIQGELGSNSHMAAIQVYSEKSESLQIVPCGLSAEVVEKLEDGLVDAAVLPIENSLHGSVAEHYDLLLEHNVCITGETMLRIHHNVIAAPGVVLAEIRRVLSHPVALSQCRQWLRAHPEIEVVPFYDTAGSVKNLMERGQRDTAGIAPELAAVQYGAQVLVHGVEDHVENFTRFYVLQREDVVLLRVDAAKWAANKMSVAFSLDHRPGSLIEALDAFRRAGLNLTRIESRPVPGMPWEYVFFVDLRFESAAQLHNARDALAHHCRMVKELGRYTAA